MDVTAAIIEDVSTLIFHVYSDTYVFGMIILFMCN